MNVLITGVAGFIGSHVADALINRGDDVYGIDNLDTGRETNVHADVDLTIGDITDTDHLDDVIARADPHVIVHAAATYADPDAWARDLDVNASATAMIADRASSLGAHLVYFQTSLCYGVAPDHPLTVEQPLAPTSSYAISKVAGERYIRLSGCQAAVLRLANMYGPRNLSGPVPVFWQRLSSAKPCSIVNARRDYVHVSDLVRLVLAVIDDRAHGVWHASTGADVSIRELYEAVVDVGGYDAPPPRLLPRGADDVASLLLDNRATVARFGWQPTTGLADGLDGTLAWYDAHGVERAFTHLRLEEAE